MFEYKQYVKIKPLDRLKGRIVEISIKSETIYCVEYYLDGDQRRAYFYEDELIA